MRITNRRKFSRTAEFQESTTPFGVSILTAIMTPFEMAKMIRALTIQHNVLGLDMAEYNHMIDSRSFQMAEVVMFLLRNFMAAEAGRKHGITDPLCYAPGLVRDERQGM